MAGIDTGRGGLWKRKKYDVVASASLVIHSIPLNKFRSVDYILSASNFTEQVSKSLSMKAHNNFTSIQKSVYSKAGKLKISFVFSMSGGRMILTITNNELYDIKLEYARLVVGA